MEQACGVMSKSNRAVPIFNDKHLSCERKSPTTYFLFDLNIQMHLPDSLTRTPRLANPTRGLGCGGRR
eukprot:COSAG05_NODE_1028_length_6112_cov_11.983868_7_plen_68_part_00